MSIERFLPSSLINPVREQLHNYANKDHSDSEKQQRIYKDITSNWNYDFSFNPLQLIAKLVCAIYFYTAGQFLIDTFIQREIKQVKAEEFPKILRYMNNEGLFNKKLKFHEENNLEHQRNFISKDNVALFQTAGLEERAYAGKSLEEAVAYARAHILFEAGADENFREFLRLDKQDAASINRLSETAQDLSYDQCNGSERNLFINILFEKARLGDNWKKAIKALPQNEQALLRAFSNPVRENAFLVDAFVDSEYLRNIKSMFLDQNPDIKAKVQGVFDERQIADAKRIWEERRNNPNTQTHYTRTLEELSKSRQADGIDILKELHDDLIQENGAGKKDFTNKYGFLFINSPMEYAKHFHELPKALKKIPEGRRRHVEATLTQRARILALGQLGINGALYEANSNAETTLRTNEGRFITRINNQDNHTTRIHYRNLADVIRGMGRDGNKVGTADIGFYFDVTDTKDGPKISGPHVTHQDIRVEIR